MGSGHRLGMLGFPGMGRRGTAGGSCWRLLVEGEDQMSCLGMLLDTIYEMFKIKESIPVKYP